MEDQSGEFREPKPLPPSSPSRTPRVPSGLCERLRVACKGLTLREIAAMTGASKEAVRRYLAGSPPSVEFLARLCEAQSLSADWLLCGVGPPGRSQQRRTALTEAALDELHAELMDRLWPVLEALRMHADQPRVARPGERTVVQDG